MPVVVRRVLGVIALPALPLMIVAAILLWRSTGEAEATIAEDRVGLARAAALTADVLIEHELSILQSLAIFPIVRDPARAAETTALLDQVATANPNTPAPGSTVPTAARPRATS